MGLIAVLTGCWLGLSICVFIASFMFILNNDTEFFDYFGIKTFGGMILAVVFPWILIIRLSPKILPVIRTLKKNTKRIFFNGDQNED
jgi:hypothetical protein